MTSEFEDEVEQTFTIDEFLEGMEERELEADLVLGGDEGKECTYNNGYMKRQAIFSCLTCTPEGNAGVCTACSLSCHDGHEIIELWTKRNFRCDCGNSKFGEVFCKLNPSKDIENAENSYNHNFKGLYCTCGRPYPDTEAEEQEEMIQCCVCEDWFHEEHLVLQSSDEVPRDEEEEPLYEDFICSACSEAFSFLRLYPQSKWEAEKKKHATESKDKEVMEDTDRACGSGKPDSDIPRISSESGPSVDNFPAGEAPEKDAGPRVACVLGGADLATVSDDSEKRPIFLSKNWRDAICRCEKCVEYYKEKGVGFLLGKEDSIAEYEKIAKQKREVKLQQPEGGSLDLLDNLDHVGKMEVLHGIADMKDEIHSFLETFDASKAITSADVRQVFENLAKRRRR